MKKAQTVYRPFSIYLHLLHLERKKRRSFSIDGNTERGEKGRDMNIHKSEAEHHVERQRARHEGSGRKGKE